MAAPAVGQTASGAISRRMPCDPSAVQGSWRRSVCDSKMPLAAAAMLSVKTAVAAGTVLVKDTNPEPA